MRKTLFPLVVIFGLGLAACGGYGGPVDFTISGRVTLAGSGFEGATLTLTGEDDGVAITNASGDYSFPGLRNGTYTLKAFVPGCDLIPPARTVNIAGADVTGQNFSIFVPETYAVKGRVTLNDQGYEGATVALTGDSEETATTNATGDYAFAGLANGSYTVRASVDGQTLWPELIETEIDGADSGGNDFVFVTYGISGRVTNGSGAMEWIKVNLTGVYTTTSTRTDWNGDYTFTGVPNGSYTVAPQSVPQIFNPAGTLVQVEGTDEGDVDFSVPSMIWIVDGSATGLTQDGYSWETALRQPHYIYGMTSPGDQVWLAGGTYLSMDTSTPIPVLTMETGVAYYGGFVGTEEALSQRTPGAVRTILDGENEVDYVVIGADQARLDGFVVTRGGNGLANGAGMLNDNVSGLKVINCVFSGNETPLDGGGMYNNRTDLLIANCLFKGNSSSGLLVGSGGAIAFFSSQGHIVNTTFTENTVSLQGGAIYLNRQSSLQMVNSIAFFNLPDQIAGPGDDDGTKVTFSDIQGGHDGEGNIDDDPQFSDEDCRLRGNSPCIDAGLNSEVITDYDLDGNDRILDGDGTDPAAVDMGAFEYVMQ